MKSVAQTKMCQRIVDPARRTVRRWVFGDVVRFDPGPPYLIAESPSYAPARVVVHSEDDRVRVGRYSGVHPTVTFLPGGEHRTDFVTTWYFSYLMGIGEPETSWSRGPIVVGNDVWIGREAMVVSGVTIGDGAVVGTRALVTKDVAPYEIVGGVPARHLRWRFSEEIRPACSPRPGGTGRSTKSSPTTASCKTQMSPASSHGTRAGQVKPARTVGPSPGPQPCPPTRTTAQRREPLSTRHRLSMAVPAGPDGPAGRRAAQGDLQVPHPRGRDRQRPSRRPTGSARQAPAAPGGSRGPRRAEG